MLDICSRCLRPNDEGRHRPHCRVKKCPACLAYAGWPHDPECPDLLAAIQRTSPEEKP